MRQIITIHAAAPAKPAWGAVCNGCGVCCAAEPCPVGVVVSMRRHGSCKALHWHDKEARYLCGVLADPRRYFGFDARWLRAWVRRIIAAGRGCDSDAELE